MTDSFDDETPDAGGRDTSRVRVVVMREDHRPDLDSHLTARFDDDGDLVIEGHDLGPFVEARFGDSDYEYAKTIRKQDIPALLEVLGEDPGQRYRGDVLDVIERRWCGSEASYEFERRLRESDIEVELWTWI